MKFKADIIPIPQKRPRAAVVNGRVVMYDHPDCKKYKTALAQIFKAQMGNKPLMTYPFEVYIGITLPIPKSWSRKKREEATAEKVIPDKRQTGDIDNLIKPVLDAANGVIWQDDCQVVAIGASKKYGATPGVELYTGRRPEWWKLTD